MKIGIITTSRADYGIYRPILFALKKRKAKFELYVTGSHLHAVFGNTVRDIERDGFPIAARLRVRLGSTPYDVARTMGEVTKGFADILKRYKPAILVVLGDRYEMHSAALAAVPLGIPIAHVHGGELTQGVFDDQMRHSLTKLSSLHFASTQEYARRIRQMGEEPFRVIVSGAPGLDCLDRFEPVRKEDIARTFKIDFSKEVFLVTFHPVTLAHEKTGVYIGNLLNALKSFKDAFFVFTGTNADTSYDVIEKAVCGFVKGRNDAVLVRNFGSRTYMSMLSFSQVMVGNSSSGIIEAASWKLPVVNIGTRQAGRVRPANVIDVGYSVDEIRYGIRKARSSRFKASLKGLNNPYFKTDSAKIIADTLCRENKKIRAPKEFKDIAC